MIQIIGTKKKTVIAIIVKKPKILKSEFSAANKTIEIITTNAIEIIHIKLVISSNFKTFISFSPMNAVT